MTDDERIALREAAVQTIGTLQGQRILRVESELKLHDECAGTGIVFGSICKYCAGSGRVVYHVATTVVPFRGI